MRREYVLGSNISALTCVLNNAVLNKEVKLENDLVYVVYRVDGVYTADNHILYLFLRGNKDGDTPLPLVISLMEGDRIIFDLDMVEIIHKHRVILRVVGKADKTFI